MNSVEITAKKVDKAIEEGLKALGVASVAEVKIEILDEGGIFRKAKVRLVRLDDNGNPIEEKPEVKVDEKPQLKAEEKVEVKEEKKPIPASQKSEKPAKKEQKPVEKQAKPVAMEKKATVDTAPVRPAIVEETPVRKVSDSQVKLVQEYLEKLLGLMKIDAKVEIDLSHGNVDVNLVTTDTCVIGHRGEVLDALQLLAKRAVEEGEDKFVHVTVDSQNYRARREQSLVALAQRMAKKCEKTGRKVVLEPMNNTHRRVIHATLSSSDKVITKSEGREPNRRVVILPKRNDKKQ